MGILSLPSYGEGLAQGNTQFAILGTGDSGPVGVEAIIEYAGMILNNRNWIDTFLITSIDGLHDADIRDQREVNPAQHGETAFDAFYGGRTVALTGKIRAHHIWRLRDMQLGLRETFADLTSERPLIFHHHNNPDKSLQLLCRKSQPIAMGEAQQNFQWEREFQITLRASNPRFLGTVEKSKTIAESLFNEGTVLAVNDGNFRAQPIITLANAMTAPTLFNETTGQQLILSGDITNGESITIDIAANRMFRQDGVSVFNRLSPASDWPELIPGGNVLSLSTASSDASALVTVKWRTTVM